MPYMGDKGDKSAAHPPEGSLVETRCLKGPKSAIVPLAEPRSGPKSRTDSGVLPTSSACLLHLAWCLCLDAIARLQFEQTYYDVAVQHVCHGNSLFSHDLMPGQDDLYIFECRFIKAIKNYWVLRNKSLLLLRISAWYLCTTSIQNIASWHHCLRPGCNIFTRENDIVISTAKRYKMYGSYSFKE